MVHSRHQVRGLERVWFPLVDIWKTYFPPPSVPSPSLIGFRFIAGSGKSILRHVAPNLFWQGYLHYRTSTSSAVIQDIQSISNAGSAAYLSYFYFDFKDTGKQDLRALLSSVLVQFCEQSDICCDVLSGLYARHQDGSQQPPVNALKECLKSILTIAGQVPIYLVVDALDECPDSNGIPSPRGRILELVEELVDLHLPNLRLCVTSRPEIDIRTVIEPLTSTSISLHDELGQKKDILDYITSVVRSERNMKRWTEKDRKLVIETISERAGGM